MKNKINVGIIGACASRDAFNTKITPNYKDIFNVCCYDFQMSFASLMSSIIEYDAIELTETINKVEYIERTHLYEDFNKSFLNVLAVKQPDILIIDFYADVNFGFIELNNSYITDKLFKYEKCDYIAKQEFGKKYSGRGNYDEFFEIWSKSVERFMEYCKEYIPDTTIILNDFRLATYYYNKSKDKYDLVKENHSADFVGRINAAIEKCNKWFIEKYKPEVIDLTQKEYYGNPAHLWGLDHLHFLPDYYSDFLWKLLDICLDNFKEDRTSKLLNKQLLQNGNFSRDFAGWVRINSGWEIIKENDYSVLSIDKSDNDQSKNWQIWSESFEVFNGNSHNEITISFEVESSDWDAVDAEGIIFCVRTFNKKECYTQSDSVEEKIFYKKDYSLVDDEWIKISYSFNPTGRFLRVAPYLQKNGNIRYRDISVVYGSDAIEEWEPPINERLSC